MNVRRVAGSGLCTGCGVCTGMCPRNCIRMLEHNKNFSYIPKINLDGCNKCGRCLQVCPGLSVDFEELNRSLFNDTSPDIFLGSYMRCHIGHAVDHNVRYNSTSGGLVSALLIFALEKGIIDGAVVITMDEYSPTKAKVFIAETREEILSASGSKYCPTSPGTMLYKILQDEKRYGVVGLPCHIHGFRKAQEHVKGLKDRLVLFGIFCSYGKNFRAMDFLLRRLGIARRDIKKLDYRGQGWPGKMLIELNNGTRMSLPLRSYYNQYFTAFTPLRCTLCSDGTNELADLSFGDAWLPEFRDDDVGKSVVVCRSSVGESILQQAIEGNVVELDEVNGNKIFQSQKTMLLTKKRALNANMRLFRLFGKDVPVYSQELQPLRNRDYLQSALFCLKRYISRNSYLWYLLHIFPLLYYLRKLSRTRRPLDPERT